MSLQSITPATKPEASVYLPYYQGKKRNALPSALGVQFIDDIVAGVLSAYDRTPDHGFRIWNLGGNRPVRLDEMINTVAECVGKEAVLDHQPAQMGDVTRTFAALTRAREELGYEPQTAFEDGVAKQVAWYRQQMAAKD